MIASWQSADGSTVGFRLKGNFSLGAGGLLGLIMALAVVTLILAGLLAWQGFWPVLAIAIIQVILVSWILVRTWERTWRVEIIEVGPERIRVTQQQYKRKRHAELETAWAVVEVERPAVAWYDPKVQLRCGKRRIELGRFLTGEEKHQLAEQLTRAIKKHSAL